MWIIRSLFVDTYTFSCGFCVLLRNQMCIKMFMNIFQVVLKGDNSTQLVQDDQVKGPLRVCILHAFLW